MSEDISLQNYNISMNALIAEDNDVNWEIIEDLLHMNGVTSERATNGEECFRKFIDSPEGTYDVIFMDLQMPVMDGFESTRMIRSSSHPEGSSIPIYAVSANFLADDDRLCRLTGMNGSIPKPINVNRLSFELQKVYNAKNK